MKIYILLFTLVFFIIPVFLQNVSANESIQKLYYEWIDNPDKFNNEIKLSLNSNDIRKKNYAILAAGKRNEKIYIPYLINILKNDKNISTRNCAVTALGDLGSKKAVPILLSFLESKQRGLPNKKVIIKSLGKIKAKESVTPLVNIIYKDNNTLKNEASKAVINIGDKNAVTLLMKFKRDKNFPIIHTAQIIGELNAVEAESFLISSLKNSGANEKRFILNALGKIKSKKAIPYLINNLKTDNKIIGKISVKALINIDSDSATDPLCKIIKDSFGSIESKRASYILANLNDKSIEEKIYKIFESFPKTNVDTSYILGRKKFKRASFLMKKRLADNKQPGRFEMALALGLMVDKSSIPLLIKILKEEKYVSKGAIISLGRMESKKAVPYLIDILKKNKTLLISETIIALGRIKDEKTVPHLIDFYYASELKYQLQVGIALAEIGGKNVDDFIKSGLESDNPKLKKMSSYILLKYNKKSSKKILADIVLNNPNSYKDRFLLTTIKKRVGKEFTNYKDLKKWASSI